MNRNEHTKPPRNSCLPRANAARRARASRRNCVRRTSPTRLAIQARVSELRRLPRRRLQVLGADRAAARRRARRSSRRPSWRRSPCPCTAVDGDGAHRARDRVRARPRSAAARHALHRRRSARRREGSALRARDHRARATPSPRASTFPELLADSIANLGLFVGPGIADPWRRTLDAFPITVHAGRRGHATRDGKHPDGHPLRAALLARQLPRGTRRRRCAPA